MPLSPTQAWLRENTRFYANPHRVYADADPLLARFPLRPKTDVYSAPSLPLARPAHLSLHSLRRWTDPAPALYPRYPPHRFPPGVLQHPRRDLGRPRLSKGSPDCLCCSHPGHAHPLQPIHRPQWSLQHRIHSELAAQERGTRLSRPQIPRSALIRVDPRVATLMVSWKPCRPTSPKSLRSMRNPRIPRLPSLPLLRPRPTVIPQNLHPRSPPHSFSSLDHRQTHLFLPPHRHRNRPRYRQQITLADRPFLRNLVRHRPCPLPLRLRRFSSPRSPRHGIPHE